MQQLWNIGVQLWQWGVQFVTWLSQFEVAVKGANAVWDGIMWAFANLSPFAILGKALRGLIDLLNQIPGINIDTSFADLPEVPGAGEAMSAAEQAAAAQRAQQTINAAIPLPVPPPRPPACRQGAC
ncbi:hypothetical protein [Pseudomonas solani]|uniref:hypothetical protein n=1 Tax=Pseudomonas solani TaxID=2731552 RepID=UPI003D6A54F2